MLHFPSLIPQAGRGRWMVTLKVWRIAWNLIEKEKATIGLCPSSTVDLRTVKVCTFQILGSFIAIEWRVGEPTPGFVLLYKSLKDHPSSLWWKLGEEGCALWIYELSFHYDFLFVFIFRKASTLILLVKWSCIVIIMKTVQKLLYIHPNFDNYRFIKHQLEVLDRPNVRVIAKP